MSATLCASLIIVRHVSALRRVRACCQIALVCNPEQPAVRFSADNMLLLFLQAANAFVAHGLQRGGVLVHCYAGQSRSAVFVLAYLIACESSPFFTGCCVDCLLRSMA